MARSASDATRFTPTTPYASAKSKTTGASSIQIGHGAPAGETPQQKVARLRAAAQQAKMGKESGFDQVIRVGRRWADRAHRFTAYSLIGLTVVSGVTASFAIGDMLMHNRRKRNEWLADQQAKHQVKIEEARVALNAGLADEDQKLLLNQERTKLEAADLQKKKPGMFSRIFSSSAKEEQQGGNLGAAARAAATEVQDKTADLGVVKAVKEAKAEEKRLQAAETATKFQGGMLDREAEAAVHAVSQKSQSWTDWVLRRS